MSEKPQHGPDVPEEDVSRETGRDSVHPDPERPEEPSPSHSPSSSPAAKNKRSSVYVYLVVLFGAAFLMLLLAYFIQQRNNATVLNDLRATTASRQELLENIEALEAEKEGLGAEKESLQAQVDQLQQQIEEEETRNFFRERALEDEVTSWQAIHSLEKDFLTESYDGCVVFFENALTATHYFTPPEAAARVEEIYHELVKKGILNEEDYPLSTILGPSANQ